MWTAVWNLVPKKLQFALYMKLETACFMDSTGMWRTDRRTDSGAIVHVPYTRYNMAAAMLSRLKRKRSEWISQRRYDGMDSQKCEVAYAQTKLPPTLRQLRIIDRMRRTAIAPFQTSRHVKDASRTQLARRRTSKVKLCWRLEGRTYWRFTLMSTGRLDTYGNTKNSWMQRTCITRMDMTCQKQKRYVYSVKIKCTPFQNPSDLAGVT